MWNVIISRLTSQILIIFSNSYLPLITTWGGSWELAGPWLEDGAASLKYAKDLACKKLLPCRDWCLIVLPVSKICIILSLMKMTDIILTLSALHVKMGMSFPVLNIWINIHKWPHLQLCRWYFSIQLLGSFL